MSVVSPTGLIGARSPIYITAGYSGVSDELFSVELSIKVWDYSRNNVPSGYRYVLFRDVFVSADVSFDIAPLVAEFIADTYDAGGTNSPSKSELSTVVWCRVDYEVTYLDRLTSTSQIDQGSTDIFAVSNGYHLFSEGANYTYSNVFLTNTKKIYVKEFEEEMIPLHLGEWGNETPYRITYDDLRGGTTALDLTSYYSDVQPEGRILMIPTGTKVLDNWLNNNGSTAISPRTIDNYRLIVTNSAGAELDRVDIEVICEPKYTIHTIEFINRFGAWDYMHFFKASKERFSVTKEQYKRAIGSASSSGYSYDTTTQQIREFNKNGREVYLLNSGYVDETYGEVLKDIIMSERVMLNGKPANTLTSAIDVKSHINDKAFSYTLEVELAADRRYV